MDWSNEIDAWSNLTGSEWKGEKEKERENHRFSSWMERERHKQ